MARTIVYTRKASRALTRMPANVASLIRSKLDLLATNPAALANNVKTLQGSLEMRLRVGDWRVVFTTDPDRIVVWDVGSRGSIYD